jgi:ABC-type antimicrobial peptide transport system permease subunit
MGLLGFLILVAIFAPLITSYDPNEQDLMNTLLGPTAHHWLGTDPLGRDVFTRLIYGARVDLTIGLLAVVLPYLIGVSLGLLTGWVGGATDSVIMRIVDTVIAFPFYVLAIALIFVFGPGIKSIIVAITSVGWVAYCRIVRANVLVAKQQDYVHAARLTGPPSQCDFSINSFCHERYRPKHLSNRLSRLSRTGSSRANCRVGLNDSRRPVLHHRSMVALHDSRTYGCICRLFALPNR